MKGRWIVALGLLALMACGRVEPDLARSGLYRGVDCRSADQVGLIPCHEAIDRAATEAGSASDWGAEKADAQLDSWRRQPGSEAIRIWAITYHGVEIPLRGPPVTENACLLGGWSIAIDARTGRYLVEGTTGEQHSVPCTALTD